jgi:hypothetical protein
MWWRPQQKTSDNFNKNLCFGTILSDYTSESRSINPFNRFRTIYWYAYFVNILTVLNVDLGGKFELGMKLIQHDIFFYKWLVHDENKGTIFINMEHYKIWSHSVGNHFLKLLVNLASNYWNLLAKIKFH